MKTIAVLFISAAAAFGQASTRVYHVSKAAGDAHLIEVFESVAALEANKIPTANVQVWEKIDATTFVVWKRKSRVISNYSDRLTSIGGSMGGRHVPLTKDYTDTSIPYLLTLTEPLNAASGEIIPVRYTETTETREIHGETLRVLKVESSKPITKADFLAMLKAGRTWSLDNFKRKRCPDCGGDGKLSAMQKYAKCNDCAGVGSFPENWTVLW